MRQGIAVTAVLVLLLAGCDGSGGDPEPDPSAGASSGTSEPSESSESSESGESVSDSPTGDPGPIVTCPDATLLDTDPALPDAVPDGATSVRLCDGGADKVTPPVDALTTDVASVVTAVNSQRLVSRGCVDRRIPEYNLAFGYPDGSSFVVAGRFTACAELLVGSARRAKALPALNTFMDGLLAQRAAATPPNAPKPATLDCGQPLELWTGRLADPAGLTVAVLCVGLTRRPDAARRVVVPTDDLRTLVASMRTHSISTDDIFTTPYFGGTDHWLVGTNAWGDPITVIRGILGLTLAGGREWLPRGEARTIIKELVARAR